MSQAVYSWDTDDGSLCLELIESIHIPANRFRISPCDYDIGTHFGGASRAQRCYLLDGSCEYVFGDETWSMVGPCYADLPCGKYQFRALGESAVSLVHVWELPSDFW